MMHPHLKLLADLLGLVLLLVYILQVALSVHPKKMKIENFTRTGWALLVTFILAHINRWAHLWPGHYFCPSGHMTFFLTVATACFLVDRRSAFFTIPLALLYGELIVFLNFHIWLDLAGALFLAVPVTLLCHRRKEWHPKR